MKIKKKRRVNIVLDMTPMVDIAFLLLIFYMATTQFKPPEKKEVNLPESRSQIELPKRNVFTITVPQEDSIFIDFIMKSKRVLDDGSVIETSDREVTSLAFNEVDGTGEAVQRMRQQAIYQVRDIYPGEENKTEREKALKDVVESLVVVKADKEAPYGIMEKLMNSLRDNGLNTFQVITELESEQ